MCIKGGVYSDTTQLNSTELDWTQLDSVNSALTQFVGRDVINKNTTVQLGQLDSVELSCVAINTHLNAHVHNRIFSVKVIQIQLEHQRRKIASRALQCIRLQPFWNFSELWPYPATIKISWWYLKRFKRYCFDRQTTDRQTDRHIRKQTRSSTLYEQHVKDRSHTTFYWSAIVNIALSCTVFELFDVE